MVSTAPPNGAIDDFSLEDDFEAVFDRSNLEEWAHTRSKTKVKSKVGVPPALPVEGVEPWKENVLVWEFEEIHAKGGLVSQLLLERVAMMGASPSPDLKCI